MKNIFISLVALGSLSAMAADLPLCTDAAGPRVRLWESKVVPSMPGFDSIELGGQIARDLYAAMTSAPSGSLVGMDCGNQYATSCTDRGTIAMNCMEILYKDYNCSDYHCSIAVSDLRNGKL